MTRASTLGLTIESGAILFSEEQGFAAEALVSVDRWLTWERRAIRVQVRVIARAEVGRDVPWEEMCDSSFSTPLTFGQASQLVDHWSSLEREAIQRAQKTKYEDWERSEAFGRRAEPPRMR